MVVILSMRINLAPDKSFQGYDARRLKAICIGTNRSGVANELSAIGKRVGFDVFIPTAAGLENIDNVHRAINLGHKLWLQDLVTTTPQNLVLPVFATEMLARFVAKAFNKDCVNKSINIPAGGNMFYMQNSQTGMNDLLIGADDVKDIAQEDIKSVLGVDNITAIPQMDFHIDMFLRPLENNTILIADDEMTLRVLRHGMSCINNVLAKNPNNKNELKKIYKKLAAVFNEFQANIEKNTSVGLAITESRLKKSGYMPVRVPGRIYTVDGQNSLRHTTNFMNAIVTKNDKDELVYITNKSFLDEDCGIDYKVQKQIGFSFEQEFLKSILAYVKPRNVHFVSGEERYLANLLHDSFGGIHCITTEIL